MIFSKEDMEAMKNDLDRWEWGDNPSPKSSVSLMLDEINQNMNLWFSFHNYNEIIITGDLFDDGDLCAFMEGWKFEGMMEDLIDNDNTDSDELKVIEKTLVRLLVRTRKRRSSALIAEAEEAEKIKNEVEKRRDYTDF
jgi:hypothetical protein